MEKYTGIPDEWRDEDGNWHDGRGQVFERKRDLLQSRAEGCKCGQCKRRYENYMTRIDEDKQLLLSTIATLELNWLLHLDPYHTEFWINSVTGSVDYAYPQETRMEPWIHIDISGSSIKDEIDEEDEL